MKLWLGYLSLASFATAVILTSFAIASESVEPQGKVILIGSDRITLHSTTLIYSPVRGLPTSEGIEVQMDGKKVLVFWSEVESLTLIADETPPHWQVKLKDGREFPDYGSLHADTEFVGEVRIDGIGRFGGVESYSESPQDLSSQDFRKIIVDF